MKKLLLVLMVVALASFLFVGCVPTTVDDGDDVVDGETVVGICPTVSVTSQTEVDGKLYIKGKTKQTITVTFAVPTEPVAVYVGNAIKATPTGAAEVVMYTTDKMVYTGDYKFGSDVSFEDCNEAYIYVDTCLECDYCKYPYTVDTGKPFVGAIEICSAACSCDGCELSFTSKKTADCDACDPKVYCGDCCSGFASWSVDLYNKYPFDVCCDSPCAEPIDSGTGDCQIDFTSSICLLESPVTSGEFVGPRSVYALVTLLDNVGNKKKMLTLITLNDTDTCESITLSDKWATTYGTKCADTAEFVVCSTSTPE